VDENGVITWANLIVSTGHNNLAMNRSILEIARRTIKNGVFDEGILNQVEGGIRAFDPCLSCSVHAIGRLPLEVQVVGPEGEVRQRLVRD
jgi:NAD-reducing hydrogenase large subunit